MPREKQLGRAIQRTLTILQLYLKTMNSVNLDESWSLRSRISGSDPQICPLSNSCGHSWVAFSKIIVEGQLLIWKPKMKPRMRLDSRIITGNEHLYIFFFGKVIHGDENNVCDGRLHFTITATCPSDCCMWDCFPFCCFTSTTFWSCPLVKVFFNDIGSRPNSYQSYVQLCCAKWRLDVQGTILAFAHHTDWRCQYKSWPKRIILF